MARISKSDVARLARLSNISLADNEVEPLRADLENILGYVQKLSELDTTDVEPTYQVTGLENVERSDKIIDYGVSREALLKITPASTDHQIKVPKVI